MSLDIAARIEEEYGTIAFKTPSIEFGYNKIELREKLSIVDLLIMALTVITPFILFILINFPARFIFIPLIPVILVFVQYHAYFDTVTIDFLQKEIRIENKFYLVNEVRRLLNRRSPIGFSDIAYFLIDDGKNWYSFTGRLSFHMRTTTLYVKPAYKSEIPLASFSFERDARRLGELLQFYVVGKPGRIE